MLVAAVVVFLGLLIFRNVCPSKWRWWYFVIPVLIAGAGFGIDWLVQTDREKIKTVLNIAVKAVEQENPKALAAVISDNYRDSLCSSKEALINSFQSRFAEPLVDKIIARIISLEISSPLTSATVIFTARVLFDPRSSVYDFKREVFAKVELNLRKKTGRWLITQAELLELDLRPVSWRDIEQADW